MSLETGQFEFGEFVLDAREKVLLRQGKSLPITPKVFELLLVLVENHGHLLEKTTLMEKLWANSFVEESNLTFSIRQLRKILGDDVQNPRFIETVPKRGYRFIADLSENLTELESIQKPESLSNGNSSGADNIAPGPNSMGENLSVKATSSGILSALGRRPVFYSIVALLLGVFFLTGFFVLRDYTSLVQIWRNRAVYDRDYGNLTIEPLTDTGNAISVNISPDGKLLAYVSVDAGKHAIWLRQLATGKSVPVVPATEDFIVGISFSNDGEFLYYLHQPQGAANTQLSRMSILGGTSTKLLSNFHGGYSFSPDERRIAFVRMDRSESVLIVADTDGGNERKVLSYPRPLSIVGFSWSPDGRWLAYCITRFSSSGKESRLAKFDLESGTEQPITDSRWNYLEGLMWLPDGTGFLACGRERAGEPDQIWFVSAEDGKAEQITRDSSQLSLMGATADFSKIVLSKTYLNSTISIADSNNLSVLQPVSKALHDVSWTPDGKIVFPSKDTLKTDIWIANANGSEKKQLTSNDAVERSPVVSADGKFIAFVSSQGGQQNIWRMELDGNNPTQLTFGEGENSPSFADNGNLVIFNAVKDGSLWQVPIEGGEPILLLQERSFRASVSPSGNKIAYFGIEGDKGKLFVKSVPEFRLLHRFDVVFNRVATPKIVWSDDEKSLIYYKNDLAEVGNLWRQSLAGEEPQKLTNFTGDRIFDFSFSSDGTRIAIARGSWKHDAVLLKGFR